MLGLFVLSLTLLSLDHPHPVLAAIPFVLSLCFKQMALYYAPVIFIYLLSVSFSRITEPDIVLLGSLGLVVIVTFTFIFLPFLLPVKILDLIVSHNYAALFNIDLWRPYQWDLVTPQQVIYRVFPFGRGLWEDKVANTWCATNILIKWRSLYSTPTLKILRLFTSQPNLTTVLSRRWQR
jgi:alpha-1,3-glucosyltransferase